jgi:hypothetical protein
MLIVRQKVYTKYDDTDSLKRMNDADILAEKKKSAPGFGSVIGTTAAGTAAGATVGSLAYGGTKVARNLANGAKLSGAVGGLGKNLVKGGKWGALAGGVLAAGVALHKRGKKSDDVDFYNRRLEYAQRQARRREKKDWKTNMTGGREGYSY